MAGLRWSIGFRRLRSQLAVIIAAALLPAGVVAVLQAVSAAQKEVDQRRSILEAEAQLLAADERDTLVEIRESLRTIAGQIGRTESREECETALESFTSNHPWLSRAAVFGADGAATCGASSDLTVAGLPEWDEFVRAPRFTIGQSGAGQLTGSSIVTAYHPISGGGSGRIALAAGVRLSYLERVTDITGDGAPLALVSSGNQTLVWNRASTDWLPDEVDAFTSYLPRSEIVPGEDGVERHYVASPLIPGQIWMITAHEPIHVSDVLLSLQGIAIATPIALWVIAVGVAFVAIDRLVTRHVGYLQRVATRIGRGNLETEIRPLDAAPEEIYRLGEAIRAMAANLSERDGRMQDLLSTQKSLLLEVHHRVKNNLQMISSLMNIQLRRARSDGEREALQLVQDRIYGLALVHQNLYATERLDHVALHMLTGDVCKHFERSLKPAKAIVEYDYDLQDVTVDAALATPVALFLTEALGNVYKHAVRDNAISRIAVRLRACDEAFMLSVENRMTVAEPAVALGTTVPGGSNSAPSGLGTRLMAGFAQQLSAELDREELDGGFRVALRVPATRRAGAFALRRDVRETGSAMTA